MSKSLDEEIQDRLDKLQNDGALTDFEKNINKFNFFTASGMQTQEIKHSKTLCFLLDPQESHKQGDLFLRKFFEGIFDNKKVPKNLSATYCETEVTTTEGRRMDIRIYNDVEKFCVCIENKIFSGESEDQLDHYYRYIKDKYPGYCKKYVFLTPEGDLPNNESDRKKWDSVSYRNIMKMIETAQEKSQAEFSEDFKYFLDHYKSFIEEHILKTSEEAKNALKLYKRHKKAFDFIIQNIPSKHSQIFAILREALETSVSETEIVSDNTKIFRFRPLSWCFSAEQTPKTGAWKDKAILFEVSFNAKDELVLELVLANASIGSKTSFTDKTLAEELDVQSKTGWPRIKTQKVKIRAPDLDVEADEDLERNRKKFTEEIKEFWKPWIEKKSDCIEDVLNRRRGNTDKGVSGSGNK
ncbi:PD-(D/E)XK nuclease family protein [Roseibium sp.]|uniref:PDDEXK-like family protein n=1 Tax=Roseibium sp. TaxID=1936156 RepID=UPI003D09C037